MKKIDSLDTLKAWGEYREYSKVSLKLLDGEEPCYVSKDKLRFDDAGKPWAGHAFLAGKKAPLAVQALKKNGVIFKEGVCRAEGKDLHLSGLSPKLVKEAGKTLLRQRLGYKAVLSEAPEAAEPAVGGSLAPEVRQRKLAELKKLGSDLDRLLSVLSRQTPNPATGA